MISYQYRPVRYFAYVYFLTWLFWFGAAFTSRREGGQGLSLFLMILGLLVPAVVSLLMVVTSKSPALKKDYREKLNGFHRLNLSNVLPAILVFGAVIVVSILVSLLFGESVAQFSFVDGFSFSIHGIPTLFALILAAFLEELGWRGYAQDAVAAGRNWFTAALIFGVLWSFWHLPLFFIAGTYQRNILEMNLWYMVNFFVSALPVSFFMTWVYVKSRRSIFACALVHFVVNFLQEQIALTQVTKCIETAVFSLFVVLIVLANGDLFFSKRHAGRILEVDL